MSEEFIAELDAEATEENIVSECMNCGGIGIITVTDQYGEHAEECSCLKDWREQF